MGSHLIRERPHRPLGPLARLPLLIVALLAAGIAVLAQQQAAAQGSSENPNLYQRPLRDGQPVDEYVIEAAGLATYTQVELYMGAGSDRTPVTYQDFGRAEFWFDQRPTGGNVPNGGNHIYRLSRVNGVWTVGAQISQCSGGPSQRCSLTKAEWQTLAGQTGAADSATVNPIRIAFNLPDSGITANTIRIGVVHYTQDATRPGSGTRWGPNADWTVVTYGAIFVPVDDDDNPLYFRNSFSQDASATTDLQYMFAAGQLSQIRLMVGVSRETVESSDSAYPLTYGDFQSLGLRARDSASTSAFDTYSPAGFHQQVFLASDGTPFAPCSNDASNQQCLITRAEWKTAAGTPDASDDDVIPPLRIAIKPPLQNGGGSDWNGGTMRVETSFNLVAGSPLTDANRQFDFDRLSAHISRMQSAYRNADGSFGGAIAPDMNSDVADDKHTATRCAEGVDTTGGSAPTSDCTRAVEVGERIYLENILRRGGTDTSANDGRTSTTGHVPNTRGSWLRADAARPGVFYDRIEVAATVGGNPGGGIVSAGTLCPIDAPADPPHPDKTAIIPRDRTAAALAKCVYGDPVKSGTYWGGTGPFFVPTASTGTVTLTLSYHKGQDDQATTSVDESLVARDSLDIPVTGATDNTDAGNGGSDWDESDLIAQLGSRTYDDSLVLLIGHRRNRGIPEFWRGLTSPTGPGSITGATYAAVHATDAITLTVPAGGGAIELLGAEKSCTADADACTLAISREDLKQAARYGVPAASRAGAIADAAPYYPARLRFTHARPGDVVISGVLTYADGTTTREFSHTAKAAPVNHGAAIAAFLPADADDRLSPRQTTMLAVGYRVPEIASDGRSWRAFNPTPEFYGITGYNTNVPQIALTDAPAQPLPATADGAYLQLGGPAVWTANGGTRLWLDADGYDHFKCVAASVLEGENAEGRICYITDADGNAPDITAGGAGEVAITANLPLWTLFGDAEPGADGGGYLRPRNTHLRQRLEVFGVAKLPVETITQVAAVSLTRKAGQTGAVKTGDPARLKLGITNENGRATAATAISSITLTTTSGKIRAGATEGEDELCSGSTTCTFTIGTASDANANDLASLAAANPALIAGIFVDLYDVKAAGVATVSATIVATSGDDPVFSTEPLTVVFSGSAASLSLSEKLLRVNAYGTPDADVEADPDAEPPVAAAKKDDRDVIKIAVTAADSRGQTAAIPRGTPEVLDPDGKAVASGISASIPDDECNAGRTTCNIVIDVNAPADSPLKSGTYKVRLASGSLTAGETSFGVGGDPAEITARLDDPGAVGTRFGAAITVLDAAGELVADGTEVTIAVERRGRAPAAVQLVSAASMRTVNGRVSAAFVVIGREVSTIKISAGAASTLAVANTTKAPTPDEDRPAQGLGTNQTNTYTTWSGAGIATASALLRDLGAAANRIFLWNGARWLVYAEINGRPIPGGIDFDIKASDVLWIGAPE